jgi:tRNA (guanine-N1)-methyltransferase
MKIPDILRSGNHAAIEAWRQNAAAQRTVRNRFDWFMRAQPNAASIALAKNSFLCTMLQ